jgi:hypothetical protein
MSSSSPILFANNASTTLAGAITASATSCTLAAGTGAEFPNPAAGQYFLLTFVDAATQLTNEIVQVTARSGDVCTIVRAQEGTTAETWQAGDIAANLWTAGSAAALGLTNTGVTSGSYTNTSLTVGLDGRLTAASSGFTPVQQGGASGQGTNKIYEGWNGTTGKLTVAIDANAPFNVATETWVGSNYLNLTGGALSGSLTVNNQITAVSDVITDLVVQRTGGQLGLAGNPVVILNSTSSSLGTLNLANGTTGNQAVSINQFFNSIGGNGIQAFPAGSNTGYSFIIQYGTFTIPADGATHGYSYVTSFPHTAVSVEVWWGVGAPDAHNLGSQLVDVNGFQARCTDTGGGAGYNVYWKAMGY